MTPLHIIALLIRSLFSNLEVRFNEHGVPEYSLTILGLMEKMGRQRIFIPAGLVLNLMDEKGYALDYHRADDLEGAVEAFCREKISREPDWFRNMTRCYLSSYLDSRITFVTMVNNRIRELAGCVHEIYLANHFANYIVRNYYRSKGLRIRQFVPVMAYLRLMGRPVHLLAKALLSRALKSKTVGTARPDGGKKSVWIEYEPQHGVWVDFRNFLGSRKGSSGRNIVYYLDRADTPVNAETTDCLEAMGFEWLDLHNLRHGSLSMRDVADAFGYCLGSMRISDPLWLLFFRLNFMVTKNIYADLFRRFNVKTLIQHQEISWIQEAQAQAVEQAGGIMVGLHWSNYLNYVYPSHLTPQHVFFVWGEAHYDLLKRKGNTIEYVLPSGLWIKESPDAPEPTLGFSDDVNFVISVFDDNAGYDLYQSLETVSAFYTCILQTLEDNPRLAAIIKSKVYGINDLAALPGGAEIAGKMESFIAQKRMIMMDFREYSPIAAAKHSDLSVSCGINSAGIIAGLHGCRVVCWDCTGWLKYPIYRDEDQKVIYRSTRELKLAIEECAKGNRMIGDLSRWAKKINYYNDLSGRERIFDFIDLFMESVGKGHDREYSLKYAVNAYLSNNNVSGEFFTAGSWWN